LKCREIYFQGYKNSISTDLEVADLIHGQINTSPFVIAIAIPIKRVAFSIASLFFASSVFAQLNAPIPASVTVQVNQSNDALSAPPVVSNETANPANAASLLHQ